MARLVCDDCGKVTKAPEKYVGRAAKCPKCKMTGEVLADAPPKRSTKREDTKRLSDDAETSSSVVRLGKCWFCFEDIDSEKDQLPPDSDVSVGWFACPACGEKITLTAQNGTYRIGHEDQLALEIAEIKRKLSEIEEFESYAKNQRRANCHYCGTDLPARTGVMIEVPSSKGKPMRRTACWLCRGEGDREWQSINQANQAETLKVKAAFVLVLVVMTVFVIVVLSSR